MITAEEHRQQIRAAREWQASHMPTPVWDRRRWAYTAVGNREYVRVLLARKQPRFAKLLADIYEEASCCTSCTS